ncbi:MAG: M1 family peptidase [Chitinophagaceae bacterium]|nr:M1 family peptidase [Chitinophagaceae bacterium]
MIKRLLLFSVLFWSATAWAQPKESEAWKKIYRAFAPQVNDLVHTRLDARFDYNNSYLLGNVWITLKPHFYPTDSLQLDAKGMDIKKVMLISGGKQIPLTYQYDSLVLSIQLGRTFKKNEQYTVYIDYVARPNEFKVDGSAAITDAKGLYFINPKGEDKDKPTQIWTQGETEATSVWVPTLDKPNQKTTQLFNLTYPSKYVSLSNGKLIAQKKNADGSRTDTWSMELPHSPYLFFIGIGDYAIVKDVYKGKEVNYYVEKAYEKVARKIFGNTPEMIAFFEKKLGVDYPWVKYSQIVGRDYVSGAMENTTATLHQESAQQDARELVDGNSWESTIAHELFHQWFGDLVTAESWSNLSVNESFADYSQLLWLEYKYGADEGQYEQFSSMRGYIASGQQSRDLIRFYYKDKEDMFDAVSYNKGGRILHMLRNYVGDEAFFASLNKYLNTYKFGNGNAHKLRLAFEAVTGKDLNWFFNQWYFGSGHPKLDITYQYDASKQLASVSIKQVQSGEKLFKLPVAIDIWHGNNKKRYQVWVENKTDSFSFSVASKPDLINVDPDRVLLAEKKENKNLSDYIFQFKHAGNYINKQEALSYATAHITEEGATQLLKDALTDPYYHVRAQAIAGLAEVAPDESTIRKMENIARMDAKRTVRADAIDLLGKLADSSYMMFFEQAIDDSSYAVAGAALEAYAVLDSAGAFQKARALSKLPAKGRLSSAIAGILISHGGDDEFETISKAYDKMPLSYDKVDMTMMYVLFADKINNKNSFKKIIDDVTGFMALIPASVKDQINKPLAEALRMLAGKKAQEGKQDLADYILTKLPEDKK